MTNANTVEDPGQYYLFHSAPGNPTGQWGHLFHHSNYGKGDGYKEAIQTFWSNDGRLFFRHHRWSRIIDDWEPWKEFARNDNPNLINTGWQSANYPGTYYKRVGDVLTIKYNFRGTGGDIAIARLPPDIFKAPQGYMFTLKAWYALADHDTHAQVNEGGSDIVALATLKNWSYQGQLTITL
ncbi:MAG: DUF859 family phage minor structural protein [Lactococcus lactis]